MLFTVLKRMIERDNYTTKEDMLEKINILYVNSQLKNEEYEELVKLINE